MAITLEQLQERLSGLEVERSKILASLHAQEGAIWECQYWIDELQREFKETHTVTTLKKQRPTGLPLDFKDPIPPKIKDKIEE